MNGAIVVDKPRDWPSHDVVNRMRRIAGTRKIGHLGTLDPSATGVLPLLLNRATRLAQFFTRNDKVYEGVIHFGWSTNTYDADGQPTSVQSEPALDRARLEELFDGFRGLILQTPPPVSAKKVAGRPAYELARKNIAFDLTPVEVVIRKLELLWVEGPEVGLRVECGAGTYVRSIAHDAGHALGCGAHLKSLLRLQSGQFTIDQARTLEQLAQLSAEGRLAEALIPAMQLLPDFPNEIVDQLTEGQIRQGRDFRVSPFRVRDGMKHVKAVSRAGELIAIGEAVMPNVYHPILVL